MLRFLGKVEDLLLDFLKLLLVALRQILIIHLGFLHLGINAGTDAAIISLNLNLSFIFLLLVLTNFLPLELVGLFLDISLDCIYGVL